MKNILFIAHGSLQGSRGGIQRVTKKLRDYLSSHGYKTDYIFLSEDGSDYYFRDTLEAPEQKMNPEQVKEYLVNTSPDIIIDQLGVHTSRFAEHFKDFNLPNIKYISVFHNTPDIFKKTITFAKLCDNLKKTTRWKSKLSTLIRLAIYPLWKAHAISGIKRIYKNNYKIADRCVMLSSRDISTLANYVGTRQLDKCIAINNPLTFDTTSDCGILENKSQRVLIVSRLNNFEKRIDLALRIWHIIEQNRRFQSWELIVVGCGPQEQSLHNLARRLKLRNIRFVGHQESEPYYETADIFMMTSIVEGWGLTLTEAMQRGVVPFAFDSYPALHDIITDGYDGFIIQDKNIKAYADKMMELMENSKLRESIAFNGLESCSRFEPKTILSKWIDLIESL